MKILIVVPTLNSYSLLKNLIFSLNEQTFKSWRVVFIEGDSNTEHRKWINNFCQNNQKFSIIYQTKKYKGIFGAMNQGLFEAKSDEWLLFLGSDDWIIRNDSLHNLSLKMKTILYMHLIFSNNAHEHYYIEILKNVKVYQITLMYQLNCNY